jgi:hypothetical protein
MVPPRPGSREAAGMSQTGSALIGLAQCLRDVERRWSHFGDCHLQLFGRDAPLVTPPDDLAGLADVHTGALPRRKLSGVFCHQSFLPFSPPASTGRHLLGDPEGRITGGKAPDLKTHPRVAACRALGGGDAVLAGPDRATAASSENHSGPEPARARRCRCAPQVSRRRASSRCSGSPHQGQSRQDQRGRRSVMAVALVAHAVLAVRPVVQKQP